MEFFEIMQQLEFSPVKQDRQPSPTCIPAKMKSSMSSQERGPS